MRFCSVWLLRPAPAGSALLSSTLWLLAHKERSHSNQMKTARKECEEEKESRKAKGEKKRPMKCRAADRCGSILPLTTILTIRYKTFSPTLINVAAHSPAINTSIIRLNITLLSGPHETESRSSGPSLLIWSQFSFNTGGLQVNTIRRDTQHPESSETTR